MRMSRLIYKSVAKEEILESSALIKLADQAAEKNREFGITGLLVLTGEQFLQVLEGPPRFLNQLYRKIVLDDRHTDVELISYEPVPRRMFSEWDMRAVALSKLPPHIHALFLKKYPHVDDTLTIPNEVEDVISLLADAKAALA